MIIIQLAIIKVTLQSTRIFSDTVIGLIPANELLRLIQLQWAIHDRGNKENK